MKSVTVINHLGESVVLELANPASSGFKVLGITGLGPTKATINTTKVSTVDGVVYNSSTVEGRNIVFQLGFLESPSIEENRLLSYKYFPIKKRVTLIFETDTRTAAVSGYIESNEPTIFSAEGETQISIVCEDAYFYDSSDGGIINTLFYVVEPVFEFPFSNESLTQKTLEMSKLITSYVKTIDYPGDPDTGININIKALGEVGDIVIYDPDTNEDLRISSTVIRTMTGFGIVAGDEININTNRGKKSVSLFRDGVSRNILNALDRASTWLQITKGPNRFAYSASYGVANLQVTIQSLILYEGI